MREREAGMKTEDWIGLSVVVLYPAMIAIERIWPARTFPRVPYWHGIGIVLFFYTGLMNALLLTWLPTEWLTTHRLFNLSVLGIVPSVVIGHMVITLVTYAWHRATHESDFLWRMFHQMHLAMYIVLPAFVAIFVLGVDPLAAAILTSIGGFNAYFQHWNVRTPRWLALFFQRPEAHCIHHQYGLHRYNYSDLPLWDFVFGSFRNPATWQGETGFDEPADQRYASMLAFVDVNAPIIGAGSLGQRPTDTA